MGRLMVVVTTDAWSLCVRCSFISRFESFRPTARVLPSFVMAGLRVLVPLDGSDQTLKALKRGARILKTLDGAEVTLLTVVDSAFGDIPEDVRAGMEIDEDHEVYESGSQVKEAFERALTVLKGAGVVATTKVLQGKPYDTILAACADYDVLLMHQLQPNQLAEKMRGSNTERLTRTCGIDVLLIREDA